MIHGGNWQLNILLGEQTINYFVFVTTLMHICPLWKIMILMDYTVNLLCQSFYFFL